MSTTLIAKKCVACGKDVTNIKRMKDSDGRYWCVDCGRADHARRKLSQSSMAGTGGACASCGETFSDSKLTRFGKEKLCAKCIRARNKGPGIVSRFTGAFGSGGASSGGKGKLIGMLLLAAVLLCIAYWVNRPTY